MSCWVFLTALSGSMLPQGHIAKCATSQANALILSCSR